MKYINVNQMKDLEFSSTQMPEPKADECLIKVKAIGVNRADILQREGKYPAPAGESSIIGLEVAGDIVKCGSDSGSESDGIDQNKSLSSSLSNSLSNSLLEKGDKWKVGDKVFGLVAGGGYAEYVVVKKNQLFCMPSNYSYQQAAATAEVFLTAYQSLFTIAQLATNKRVLIHAGASGVGTAAIQLAKAKLCYVVVTVSSEEKAQACLKIGADSAVNYNTTDFVAWTKENLPEGFDVILDVVAGNYLNKNINVAALDARIVMLSMLGGRFSDPLDIAKLLFKRINLTASTLRNRSTSYKADLVANFTADFMGEIKQGNIMPIIDSVYPWENAEQAHQKMLDNKNIGKIILMVE